ncbi:MAG: GTP-binding protein, partial [Rhodospirillaceae bacterium]|nr:GTP-binding protein [Rhodospirillaceae bacterium]
LIVLNKTDLLETGALDDLGREIAASAGRSLKMIPTRDGIVDPAIVLGLEAAAEDDLDARPSHHDGEDEHEHDDFESFNVATGEIASPNDFARRLARVAGDHDILRIKGFAAVAGKPMRLAVQGVGTRINHHFDRLWSDMETRETRLVVIGETGMDRRAIAEAIGS